jgi:hypothetical protein
MLMNDDAGTAEGVPSGPYPRMVAGYVTKPLNAAGIYVTPRDGREARREDA